MANEFFSYENQMHSLLVRYMLPFCEGLCAGFREKMVVKKKNKMASAMLFALTAGLDAVLGLSSLNNKG